MTTIMTGVLGNVISRLAFLLNEKYKLPKGVRKKITKVERDLKSMEEALCKVANVPPEQLDEPVKLWARDVRELSYDMEDVLDTFLVHADGSKPKRFKRAVKKISMLFSKFKALHQNASMIKIINKPTVDPRLEAMYKSVTQLVGIEKPSDQLISMLSPLGGDEMKMVSIVGAGGLGKTTLAKAIYDRVKVDFKYTAFVPVGRDPDLRKVFRDLLIGVHEKEFMDFRSIITRFDERQLIEQIQEYLTNKRYFIVIDDIWKTDTWETIKSALVQNNNRSIVITTTRQSDVADQFGEVYKLEPLPHDQSEKLFYTRIFGANGACPDNQLKEVSNKILKKCHGVPLAIITMAGLLVGKTLEEWIEVCNSIVSLDKKNDQVNDTEWILSLSYCDLPLHLKTCLLYLSAFPEGHLISKDSLIWKWLGEGFVHSKQGTRLFEVGEGYFNELIKRSLIMAVESKRCGIVDGCCIHDMVLDLIRVKSQEHNFITISSTNAEGTSSPSRIRRLAHQNGMINLQQYSVPETEMNILRSFIACRFGISGPGLSFLGFGLLRVVALEDFTGSGSYIQLEQVEKLVHLRYLGLGNTQIFEVPEGIGALKFLQTLDLDGALVPKTYAAPAEIDRLPSSISFLIQLVCLRASCMKMPNGGIGNLTSLEELQINVNYDGVMQFVKDLSKLRELRVLNAEFSILDDTMHRGLVESIGNLHKLRYLKLKPSLGITVRDTALWDTMLPRSLQSLIISFDLKFCMLPSCINSSDLPNLTCLQLFVVCLDEEALKNLGGLPELRHLHLTTRFTVTTTVHAGDDAFFRKLRSLVIFGKAVHFVLNEDSSVSFTIWDFEHTRRSFGSEESFSSKSDKCIVMPNLEVLEFEVGVRALIRDKGSCDNLGLECLPSLRKVNVTVYCLRAFADEVMNEEDALRRAMENHPKRPTVEIISRRGDPKPGRREDNNNDSDEEDSSGSQDSSEDDSADPEEEDSSDPQDNSSDSQEDNNSDSENEKFRKVAISKASAGEEVTLLSNKMYGLGEDGVGDSQTPGDPTTAQRGKEEVRMRKRLAKLPSQILVLQEPKRPRIMPQPHESETRKANNNQDVCDPESRQQVDSDKWILDTLSLIHHTFNLQLLHHLTTDDLPADVAHELPVLERGSVHSQRFKIPDVGYIPGDGRNVISVAQLARHGLEVVFEPTCAYVRDPATGKDVGMAREYDCVYVLDHLHISPPQAQDAVQKLHGDDGSRPATAGSEFPETTDNRFGESPFHRANKDPSLDVFLTSKPHESHRRTGAVQFYLDSGASHHMTWNGGVLRPYHADIQMEPPMQCVTRFVQSALAVRGIGYIDSKGGSLDRVLFVPDSEVNLVSISQLTRDCSVKLVFSHDKFSINRLESNEEMGHGNRVGVNYVVAHLDVGAATDWVLDTLSWHHHTPNRQIMRDLQEEPAAGGDSEGPQIYGSVSTERFNIPRVRCIVGDSRNVISVAQLAHDHGLVTVFEPTRCHVKNEQTGKIVGKGLLRDGTYVLEYLRISQQEKVLGQEAGGGGGTRGQ